MSSEEETCSNSSELSISSGDECFANEIVDVIKPHQFEPEFSLGEEGDVLGDEEMEEEENEASRTTNSDWLINPVMIGFGQKGLSHDGKHNLDDGIRKGLDRDYAGWRYPEGTYMVPDSFPKKRSDDKGVKAEEVVYNLLQQLGAQNNEPMFVVHSFDFSEHIPGNDRKTGRSWVMGETDFVIIHRQHGPLFIQVKATERGTKCKEAEEQLRKDKLVLDKYFQKLVKGKISTKKATELFKNVPAFAAMPNCPRGPDSVCVQANVLYQEDCSSLQAFGKWWKEKIGSAQHPEVDQTLYEYLVMRFVGMSHLSSSIGLCVDHTDKVLMFKTKEQAKILAGHYPPKLWIRGPAGSGKTYLLIEKAVMLADFILCSKAHEKILIVCFNSVLCKALEKALKNLLAEKNHGDADVSSVLHFKTFAELVTEVAGWSQFPTTNDEKDSAVNEALESVKKNTSPYYGYYDHIFVDEGQDLYGSNWPEMLEKMHKSSVQTVHAGLEDLQWMCLGILWVMYDINQYLYFSKERFLSHRSHLQSSAELNRVFRNTENIFKQAEKYFKSLVPCRSPITLGHTEAGLPVEWDDSLVNRNVEETKGAPSIVSWLEKLSMHEVQAKDICVLVENGTIQSRLRLELSSRRVSSQTGDGLVEGINNVTVVESIRRFKGLESKVVILYDPPFQDDPSVNTRELLYTAVSRCSCLLIVITTREGCKALKSDVGINEESRGTRRHTSRFWQMQPSLSTEYDYSCDDDEDAMLSHGVMLSHEQVKMYHHQHQQSIKRARSNEPRPMEVDGSNLIEPGDPNIPDMVRDRVFSMLGDTVQQNLEYIPCSSDAHPAAFDVPVVVAHIEYEVYVKRKADCHPRRYTSDLRSLKQEIIAFNVQKKCHESVVMAVYKVCQHKKVMPDASASL